MEKIVGFSLNSTFFRILALTALLMYLYNLQDKPARDCFDLTIQEYFHGRNKSEITIKSCFKWTLTSESPRSGMAMLIVDIPSGYLMEQTSADMIVRSGNLTELKGGIQVKIRSFWKYAMG